MDSKEQMFSSITIITNNNQDNSDLDSGLDVTLATA